MHFAKHTLYAHTKYAKLIYFEPLMYFEPPRVRSVVVQQFNFRKSRR